MTGSTLTTSTDELRTWLIQRIAEYLEKDAAEIDTEATFEAQGLDSMAALTLCDDIEDQMGLVVEPTLAWDHPTIDKLADFLIRTAAETEASR
ncbi:acyl carrier protein [Actinomadura sp. NPDC048955]|uniref:Acyl carrier protein n=1 Tax=Actinomadura luteofluorescens TaxID=46163 RepID=A0A7Y9ENR5_9ACTN|nr:MULTISPECIES: acyl carrier protein [Actinomadura]MCR3741979.1 Acyl carrier protein [Actinomadura glauciflava]NYD51165.1 acyl carrier protein [Actinomadura luteofluorescens]